MSLVSLRFASIPQICKFGVGEQSFFNSNKMCNVFYMSDNAIVQISEICTNFAI